MVNYGEVAVSELSERRSLTIGEIFPGLLQFAMLPIDENWLDQRSIRTLWRRGCVTWGDLHSLTVGDLWSVPNAGRLTVERILNAASEQAAQKPAASNSWPAPAVDTAVGATLPAPVVFDSAEHAHFRSLAEMLAEWAIDAHGAKNFGDVLDALDRPVPPDIEAALDAARHFAIRDAIRGVGMRDTSDLIAEFLENLGSTARFVVERHIARPAGRMPTLDALGEVEGITRERVRQIVKRGLERAEDLRLDSQYRVLAWRADELRRTLSAASRVTSSSVIIAIDHAARGFRDPDGCTAAEFMLWFAGEYREQDGWWVSAGAGRLELLKEAMRVGLADQWLLQRHRLTEQAAIMGLGADIDDGDLAMLAGWRSIGDDWWLRWDGTLADKAERVLRLSLKALRPDELNERIGDGHARSSVQNVLSSDVRFTRVSMDLKFSLTEWGWEEYSTAAQEIVERIERCGGEATLDHVVIELFNQFGLKESTIRAYAASPAFVVTNGRIRLRREDEVIPVNDRVASAPGLYRGPDGIIYHLRVDADLLRGSGRSIPSPLAVAIGVLPGGTRDFLSGAGGRVRVTWPSATVTGAAIGSTRAIAEHLGAKMGDVLRLVFDTDTETVSGAMVSGTTLQNRTGLTLTAGGEVAELAAALDVAPTEVRAALAERGESDVAALIPEQRTSVGLDDALSRLGGLLG
jgi:hypothetical protein